MDQKCIYLIQTISYIIFFTSYILIFVYFFVPFVIKQQQQPNQFSKSFNITKCTIIKQKISQIGLHIYLPPEICVASGIRIELYNRQICLESSKYIVQWIGKHGRQYERKYVLIGSNSLVGQTMVLILNILSTDLKVIETAKTIVRFVSAKIETNQLIIPIGDSLTNNKPWLQRVKDLSQSKIMWRGTRGTTDPTLFNGITHEGRSGAGTWWYNYRNSFYDYERRGLSTLTTSGSLDGISTIKNKYIPPICANPFWNIKKNNFDFDFYCNSKADAGAGYFQDSNGTEISLKPTGVQIYLGTNKLELDPRVGCSSICMLIDNIRNSTKGATIPIYVVNTLHGPDQTFMNPGDNKFIYDVKVHNLEKALYNSLKDYKNVFFTPIAVTHDSEYNFRYVDEGANPHFNATKEKKIIDCVHPGPSGYAQMADIIFSTIAGHYKDK